MSQKADWYQSSGHRRRVACFSLRWQESTALYAIAYDHDADVIVAGAYGHSQLREWALGGVTRDLLLRSDCCSLLSH